jgi:hypothetical protein
MKYSVLLFALFAIVFGFSSCQEDDELLPTQLEGRFENRTFVDSLDLWVIIAYDFNRTGTFQYIETVRNTENGNEIGYRRIFPGTYDWNGEIFKYFPENGEGIPFDGNEIYRPKDKLDSFANIIFDYFRPLEARLEFVQNGNTMNYTEIYPEIWEFESQTKSFIKVSK